MSYSKKGPKYLIVIISRTVSFDIRNAIRDTWLNPRNAKVLREGRIVAYFLVGIHYDSTVMLKIIEESMKFNDLIVTSLTDTYDALTFKVYIAMYFKQTYCQYVRYYVKIDDDVVIDLDRLDQQANSFKNLAHIYGALRYNESVIRRRFDKYYMPYKCYSQEVYPSFALGMMYIIPLEAFWKIWRALPFATSLKLEDVFYTGVVAEIAGVKRVNIGYMYSANNFKSLPDQWECDEYGRIKLVAASSFPTSDDLRKFYKKLHQIKCLKINHLNPNFIEIFLKKLKRILFALYDSSPFAHSATKLQNYTSIIPSSN
ncbi:unnamed protein product [Litomosoides sigmodontis]|uniref:Hexosyltransferase n=1 Tax=Litomosoides sigmodontis TaxID=42156 RepID=A0A3P6V9Z4_LITSI|nr:unnamed protein product [Litomosoides sigmodontis]